MGERIARTEDESMTSKIGDTGPRHLCATLVLALGHAVTLWLVVGSTPAWAAGIWSVALDRTDVPQYGRLEVTVELDTNYDNPYDTDQVDVTVSVIDPHGIEAVVPAFWFEPYTATLEGATEQLEPAGPGSWRARISPLRQGAYRLTVQVVDSSGTTMSREQWFQAVAPDSSGYVRVDDRNPRYFAHDDGSSYVPLGVNIDWAVESAGVFAYIDYLDALAQGGGNWTRLWMSHFGMGTALEWNCDHYTGYYDGLGRYSQQVAAKLDMIFAHAETLGVAIQLVFHQHSQFETAEWSSWEENPYNAANGGPCETSLDYFEDPTALALQRNLHRYIVARYGAFRSLLAWELFNEADLIKGVYPRTMVPWARDVARALRDLDPVGHPVTTSYASPVHLPGADLYTWDFNNRHNYVYGSYLVGLGLDPWFRVDRPLLMSEFGIDYKAETNDMDPLGVNMHNGIWSALLHGYAGGAMNWWWDSYVAVYDLWYLNQAPGAFVAGVDMARFTSDLEPRAWDGSRRLEAAGIGTGDGEMWVWVRDPDSAWYGDMEDLPPVTNGRLELPVPSGVGRFVAEYWDTWHGYVTGRAEVEASGGSLDVQLPAFERDMACKFVPESP